MTNSKPDMTTLDKKREEKLIAKLEVVINKHNAGLLFTGFGRDEATMSFLQPDCLADDLLPILKSYGEEVKKEIKQSISPDLERFANNPIEKLIDEWRAMCDELGIEVIWQEISIDEYDYPRMRPIKAIFNSPLIGWQEILRSKPRIRGEQPANETKSDLLPFKHGDEGTHYACEYAINNDLGCCGCRGHDCLMLSIRSQEKL